MDFYQSDGAPFPSYADEHAQSVLASTAMVIYRERDRRWVGGMPSKKVFEGFRRFKLILEQFKGSICADIRDKIFGFLGLVRNAPLEPDYSKTPMELFSEMMAYFSSEIQEELSQKQTSAISELFTVGRLLQRTLRLDMEGLECGARPDGYDSVLRTSGAISGRVLVTEPNVSCHDLARSAFIDNWMNLAQVGPSTRANLLQGVQGLQSALSRHSNKSFSCANYSQFLIDLSESGRTIQTVTVSFFPGIERGTPIKSKKPSVSTDTLCLFAHSSGSVGVSDVHVEEGDIVCKCSGISPTYALVLRESFSGHQIVGRAIISPVSFKSKGLSYPESKNHGKKVGGWSTTGNCIRPPFFTCSCPSPISLIPRRFLFCFPMVRHEHCIWFYLCYLNPERL